MSESRRVVIVGLGGVGSWLADAFGRVLNVTAPDSQLILVDGDHFEAKNVSRQNFTTYGNKAKSVAGDLIEKLDNILIVPKAAWIVPTEVADSTDRDEEGVAYITAESLLQDGDVLFTCVDNMVARKLLFDAAAKLDNVDVFDGGNEDDGFGSSYYYCRREGVDVTHHPALYHDEFVNPPDKNPGELSCAERAKLEGGVQLVATNLTVAAILCHDAQQALFADDSSDDPSSGYHRAGVLLTNEKMWNTDTASINAWARMDESLKETLCDVNTDVAEEIHGKEMVLDTVSS